MWKEQPACYEPLRHHPPAPPRRSWFPETPRTTSCCPTRPAEKYHQDYYERNAARYSVYRALSGRDNYIESVWGPQEAIHG